MEGKVVGEKVEGESNGSRMSENYNISDLVWYMEESFSCMCMGGNVTSYKQGSRVIYAA